jgi:hypothetical protein
MPIQSAMQSAIKNQQSAISSGAAISSSASPEQSVQADGPWTRREEVQPDETEQDCQLAPVDNRPAALRVVANEIGDSHMPGEHERDGPREQTGQQERAADHFQKTGRSQQRVESRASGTRLPRRCGARSAGTARVATHSFSASCGARREARPIGRSDQRLVRWKRRLEGERERRRPMLLDRLQAVLSFGDRWNAPARNPP